MRYLFIVFLAMLGLGPVSHVKSDGFELPKTWTKDFVISISYNGGMDGSSTHIMFSYDTCKYSANTGMQARSEKSFVLTPSERGEILRRMQEWKLDKIRSNHGPAVVYDGWSTSICFNSHCIEIGPGVTISDKDRQRFLMAYEYLEAFAKKKTGR